MINDYNIIDLGSYSSCALGCGYYNYVSGGHNAVRVTPLWLPAFGSIYYSSYYQGNNGFWSNTIYSASSAYRLSTGNGTVSAASAGDSRGQGYSIRCVAQ